MEMNLTQLCDLDQMKKLVGKKAELEELEEVELEEQLLQPPVPPGRQPTRPAPRKNIDEEDELAKLRAEMAL
ncbi:hypothetical protein Tco_1063791 [Tanacetum coccineum]